MSIYIYANNYIYIYIFDSLYEKTTNSIGSNDETNIYNIGHSSLKKEENQKKSIININDHQETGTGNKDTIVDCNLIKNESKTNHDTLNSLKTPMKYENIEMKDLTLNRNELVYLILFRI